jgi:glucose/arabinose dehydrogenase
MMHSLIWLLASLTTLMAASKEVKPISQFQIETIAQTSDVIWGFDFISTREMIFTERSGKFKLLDLSTKKVRDLAGAPAVFAESQGGLLDVRVHPKDPTKIFFTYSKPMGKSKSTTALAVGQIQNGTLVDVRDLFVAQNGSDNEIHYGSRIEFDGEGHLFVTIGDRNERPEVQKLSTHIGKIVRLKLDGSVPTDNPFATTPSAQKEIWSVGHRSPQGLVWDPTLKQLWQTEMGPRGGDELNLVAKGKNYGWPDTTYGREYWGPKIGTPEKTGIEQPKAHWVPSISPSGIAFYKGDLYIGCLSGQQLRQVRIEGVRVVGQQALLTDLNERIRNVRSGPGDFLYLSTDSGKILRLKNKN